MKLAQLKLPVTTPCAIPSLAALLCCLRLEVLKLSKPRSPKCCGKDLLEFTTIHRKREVLKQNAEALASALAGLTSLMIYQQVQQRRGCLLKLHPESPVYIDHVEGDLCV